MKLLQWAMLLVALLCLFSSCKKKEESPAVHRGSKPFSPPDAAVASSISGTVQFSGAVPARQEIDMSPDPSCGAESNYDSSLLVTNGDLANVFVYIKYGFDDFSFTPPSQAVVVAQKGCRYEPRVAAAMVGQTVEFDNDDETTHNIHMMPREIRQWNESQAPGSAPVQKKFDRPEIMIPIKCNQHPWMQMYLSVLSHPYFAVTRADGKFSIKDLPPGTYTIAAVQEKLGEKDQQVTVGPKDSKTVDFTFNGSGGAAGGQ